MINDTSPDSSIVLHSVELSNKNYDENFSPEILLSTKSDKYIKLKSKKV